MDFTVDNHQRRTMLLSPYGGSKKQNGHFPSKSPLLSKEVYYKVSSCEKRQRHSCKAFVGLSTHANMVGGGRPFMKFWLKLAHPLQNAVFQSVFAGNASAITPSENISVNTNRPAFQ